MTKELRKKKTVQEIAKQNLKGILRSIKGKIELHKRQTDNKKELLEIKIDSVFKLRTNGNYEKLQMS